MRSDTLYCVGCKNIVQVVNPEKPVCPECKWNFDPTA